MRKASLFSIIVLTAAFLLLNFNCQQSSDKSQSNLINEGRVTYEITYPDIGQLKGRMQQMLPSEMTISYKGKKSHIKTKGGSPMANSTTLYDGNKHSVTTLLNMMGKKLAITIPKDTVKTRFQVSPDFRYKTTAKTKKIAGHKCQQAIINGTDTVYFAKDFNFSAKNYQTPYQDSLPGALLRFSMSNGRFNMKAQASKVDLKATIPDSIFQVPADYEQISAQKFQEMMQQQRGGMGR